MVVFKMKYYYSVPNVCLRLWRITLIPTVLIEFTDSMIDVLSYDNHVSSQEDIL